MSIGPVIRSSIKDITHDVLLNGMYLPSLGHIWGTADKRNEPALMPIRKKYRAYAEPHGIK